MVSEDEATEIFEELMESSSIEGVRQRDYLNHLHRNS